MDNYKRIIECVSSGDKRKGWVATVLYPGFGSFAATFAIFQDEEPTDEELIRFIDRHVSNVTDNPTCPEPRVIGTKEQINE